MQMLGRVLFKYLYSTPFLGPILGNVIEFSPIFMEKSVYLKYKDLSKYIQENELTNGIFLLQSLNAVGIKVTDAVVLLNREQGGQDRLKTEGVNLHR